MVPARIPTVASGRQISLRGGMFWPILVLLLAPLAALGWIAWSRRPRGADWKPYLSRVGVLTLIGLFSAGPFVTTRSLGTSEAYNYSLAIADAVVQGRAGEIPSLVGQSEFAFNGRIHPLRTAPYFTTFAQFLDFFTFHQMSFWALQNLVLAASLIGAAFSCYACLRASAECPPRTALFLTGAYLLSPGVLAAAYAMDLYMTVTAVPFLPLVLAGNLRALRGHRDLGTYVLLACGIAACWWAHPPVALWISLATVAVHVPLLVSLRLRLPEWKVILPAVALGLVLAGFVFASALSVRSYGSMSAARAPQAVVKEVVDAFAASLRPISPAANQLGDFQLGYAYWGLLAAVIALGAVRRNVPVLALSGAALLLLAFTLPVPGVTAWLWDRMPTFAITMNGPWPMQRLYLIVAAFLVFATAAAGRWPSFSRIPKPVRDVGTLALAALVLWSVHQSWRFVSRGYSSRTEDAYTRLSHASENINLTLIAYAMYTLPPSFVNGVMDPVMEMRVLKTKTAEELLSNWKAQESWGRVVAQGTLSSRGGEGDIAELRPALKLEPGDRYRLDFTFRSPPLTGALRLIGPNTLRVYPLPQAGQPRGFGMLPENNHALTLWTQGPETEQVDVQLIGPGMGSARLLNFADFTQRKVDLEKLPIRVDSLVPLKATVRTPEAGYLEIPRVWLDGYEAFVNGQPVRAQRSPDGLVMAAVPAGESTVQIRYQGAWWLRTAFWASLGGWILLLGSVAVLVFLPRLRARAEFFGAAMGRRLWRAKWILVSAVLLIGGLAYGWHAWTRYAAAAGPLRLRLVLPRENVGRSQPLLTTGKPNAGTFLFVIYDSPTTVRVGMDVWGRGMAWTSEPIEVDYFAEHEFVISSGALYPAGHPKLKGVDPTRLEKLRNRITVQLDGRTVLDQPVFSFDSDRADVTILENRIQGSSTEPGFYGQLLEKEWLPIPQNNP